MSESDIELVEGSDNVFRDLGDPQADLKHAKAVLADEHHRSMEEEVRTILRDAVSGGVTGPRDLAKFTRESCAPLGGLELELSPRGPMR